MRLPRPHIPVEVRIRVALRQLGEMWPDGYIAARRSVGQSNGNILRNLLERLAELLACAVTDLRLDHDPALATRQRLYRTPNGGHRWSWQQEEGEIIRYKPEANDPEHLRYRPHAPQFAGSHLVKTNVRGDHGQHPDRVLIKKMRRHEKGDDRIKRRGRFGAKNKVAGFRSPADKSKVKRKWPTRPMQSASRWSTGRKLRGKR